MCVCVCVCVLHGEGKKVFASRVPVEESIDGRGSNRLQ